MRGVGKRTVFPGLGLLTGYALGFAGWVWDYLRHLGGSYSTVAHALIYAGLVLTAVAVVLLLVIWVRSRGGWRNAWAVVAAAGWTLTIIGVIVDGAWHQANPGADEANMMLLPGHQIQLIGWLGGLVGAGALLTWAFLGTRDGQGRSVRMW